MRGPEYLGNECIVFQVIPEIDSHKAFNAETKEYTIVQTGEYAISKGGVVILAWLQTGDTIRSPDVVMKSSCGVFFENLKERANDNTRKD